MSICRSGLIILLGLIFLTQKSAKAQNGQEQRAYYFNSQKLSEQLFAETALGMHNRTTADWSRLELRGTLHYRINHQLRISSGWRSNFIFSTGRYQHSELRPFQAIMVHAPFSEQGIFDHRLMLEERFFIGDNLEDHFNLRLRHRLETKIPINNKHLIDNTFYLRPMWETYATVADRDNGLYISNLKATAGCGYKINAGISIEFRWEHVKSFNYNKEINRSINNIWRIQIIHRLW